MHLRPFLRHVQVGSLRDLAQEQERNSRITAGVGSPLIHIDAGVLNPSMSNW